MENEKQMKKVVLYNTSIDSILKEGDKALDKIDYVFEAMKRKTNVVLWWRPHPLTSSTIEAMRPELQTRYNGLVERFCGEKMGIYDTTSDLNRAIAVSDAYYGNWSSVIYLYMAAGKPVLISQPDIFEKLAVRIEIRDFVEADHKLWFTSYNFNSLFYYDLETCKIQLVGDIPGERAFDSELFFPIAASGRYVILIPGHSKYIVRYDMDCGRFETCYLSGLGACRFIGLSGTEDELYLFPRADSHIVKYYINDNRVEPLIAVENQENGGKAGFKRRIARVGQDFYCVSGEDNIVYQFSPAKNQLLSRKTGDRGKRYDWVEAMDDILFLISSEGVSLTGKEGGNYIGTIEYPDGFTGGATPFADIVNDGQFLYLFPDTANMVIKIDMEHRSASCFLKCREGVSGQYLCARLVGDSIYAFLGDEHEFQVIDRKTVQYANIPVTLTEEQTAAIMERKMFVIKEAVTGEPSLAFKEVENGLVTIEAYADAIGSELDEAVGQQTIPNQRYFLNADGSCGKKIFEMIKHRIST